MQIEVKDAAESTDENYWVIQATGEQVTGLKDSNNVCHYAAKMRLNKKAGAREVGLASFIFKNADESVFYGAYTGAFFILDQEIDEYYKLTVDEITAYAEKELDEDLMVVDLATVTPGEQSPITVDFGSLLGFQFKSENKYVTANIQAKMLQDGSIILLDKFVTNVYDEKTGFTNFFFSLKPVTFDGNKASVQIQFEFTTYTGEDQIMDNNRNKLGITATKKMFAYTISTTETKLTDIAAIRSAEDALTFNGLMLFDLQTTNTAIELSSESHKNVEVYEGQDFGWHIASTKEDAQINAEVTAFSGIREECMSATGDLIEVKDAETGRETCFTGWDYFQLASFSDKVASKV